MLYSSVHHVYNTCITCVYHVYIICYTTAYTLRCITQLYNTCTTSAHSQSMPPVLILGIIHNFVGWSKFFWFLKKYITHTSPICVQSKTVEESLKPCSFRRQLVQQTSLPLPLYLTLHL